MPLSIFAQQEIDGSIISGGMERIYRLYVPAAYDGTEPVPLVINLHGFTSNGIEQEMYGDFRPIADTANFLIVHPNGTEDTNGELFWNAFGLPGVDDVEFISNLIDSLSTQFEIDPNCIYSTGMSNGGFMSYFLACQLSDRIAAIASVTGSMTTLNMLNCFPAHPMPVMEIHGTEDSVVPYDGNAGTASIDDLMQYWVEFNNCNLVPVVEPVPDIATDDGCTAELQVFENGDQGALVKHYKVIGGGHTWPGAFVNIGVTCHDFDASTEIWNFFRNYKLDQLTTVTESQITSSVVCFPNPALSAFTISTRSLEPKHVQIHNPAGLLLEEFNFSTANYVTSLPESGLYFISIREGEKRTVIKVVIL